MVRNHFQEAFNRNWGQNRLLAVVDRGEYGGEYLCCVVDLDHSTAKAEVIEVRSWPKGYDLDGEWIENSPLREGDTFLIDTRTAAVQFVEEAIILTEVHHLDYEASVYRAWCTALDEATWKADPRETNNPDELDIWETLRQDLHAYRDGIVATTVCRVGCEFGSMGLQPLSPFHVIEALSDGGVLFSHMYPAFATTEARDPALYEIAGRKLVPYVRIQRQQDTYLFDQGLFLVPHMGHHGELYQKQGEGLSRVYKDILDLWYTTPWGELSFDWYPDIHSVTSTASPYNTAWSEGKNNG